MGVQTIGWMECARLLMERFSVIYAESAVIGFQRENDSLFFLFCKKFSILQRVWIFLEVYFLKQKEIEAAAIMLRMFLVGMSLNFNAKYHDLEKISKIALLQIESGEN